MTELTHFDAAGGSRMVDVGGKEISARMARASGLVHAQRLTLALIRDRKLAKGDVLEVARLAAIMAAKRASDVIPLCHTVPLDGVHVEFAFPDDEHVAIHVTAQATGRTGVEMEALTAVAAAGLTIYDMCKAVDRGITLQTIQLEEKAGGASGHYKRHALPVDPGLGIS